MQLQKTLIIISISVLIIVGSIASLVWWLNTGQDEKTTVNINKTVIIQRVEEVEKITTVTAVLQRDMEIILDLGDFKLFGKTLLENKRTQEIAVTGKVSAGIDLSKIDEQTDINLSDNKKILTIDLPEPEIINVNIIEDKTDLISDDLTLLFKLSNLSAEDRKETNEHLLKQAIKQSKVALVNGACNDDILTKANENAIGSVKSLFDAFELEEIIINTKESANCEYTETKS